MLDVQQLVSNSLGHIQLGENPYGYDTHQIGSHYRIDTLRLQNHPASHGVHQHLIRRHIRKLLGNNRSHLIPEHHPVPLGIALGHNGQQLAGPAPRCLEREAHDALDTVAGEHGDLGGRLPGLSAVRAPALPCVLALAVFADDDPVQVAGLAVAERGGRPAKDLGGADVGVLLEALADGETETP